MLDNCSDDEDALYRLLLRMGGCSHGANPWIEKYFKDCVYT